MGSIEALAAASADMEVIEPAPLVGLLNLMPHCSLRKTETQWEQYLGVDIRLRFDDDPRVQDSRSSEYVADATPFSEVADNLGALVITGANLELAHPDQPQTSSLLPFEDISYIAQLYDVIDWAQENQKLVVYSCLASHIALEYLFGLDRERKEPKVFGVFEHEVVSPGHVLAKGLGETIISPHSRWGSAPTKRLDDSGLEIVAASEEVGWLVAAESTNIFLQGHPEYSRYDLRSEHQRDESVGQRPPANYYPNGDQTQKPEFSWQRDAKTLFANIARVISQQS